MGNAKPVLAWQDYQVDKTRKSDYKGVSFLKCKKTGKTAFQWNAHNPITERCTSGRTLLEREAALAVDKFRLSIGLRPVNILKPKIA